MRSSSHRRRRSPPPQDKRRWLDFITWYHQAIIDFAEQSLRTVLKYFPAEKVRLKPGGNARGVNPIAWGTYCPGYAKMAQPYQIVLQPADCQGAVFGDKWMGTAYQFYGVKECTEPAGDLDEKGFVRRMFSDAACGARQLFTYEFESHAADIRNTFTCSPANRARPRSPSIVRPRSIVLAGISSRPFQAGYPLRDLCDFDVLDELLIADGALTPRRYKALLIFQADIVDQPILDKIDALPACRREGHRGGRWPDPERGGQTVVPAPGSSASRRSPRTRIGSRNCPLRLAGYKGVDGQLDGFGPAAAATRSLPSIRPPSQSGRRSTAS